MQTSFSKYTLKIHTHKYTHKYTHIQMKLHSTGTKDPVIYTNIGLKVQAMRQFPPTEHPPDFLSRKELSRQSWT